MENIELKDTFIKIKWSLDRPDSKIEMIEGKVNELMIDQ
jgi:hypothetical protein